LSKLIWIALLTFPIWLYWIGALIMNANAPIAIYLILIIVSYYAIVVYAPYIGIPWLLIVAYMAIRAYRGHRKRKHNAQYIDGKKVVLEEKFKITLIARNSHLIINKYGYVFVWIRFEDSLGLSIKSRIG